MYYNGYNNILVCKCELSSRSNIIFEHTKLLLATKLCVCLCRAAATAVATVARAANACLPFAAELAHRWTHSHRQTNTLLRGSKIDARTHAHERPSYSPARGDDQLERTSRRSRHCCCALERTKRTAQSGAPFTLLSPPLARSFVKRTIAGELIF